MQPLLREKLFDRLDLWVHLVVLGVGKNGVRRRRGATNVTPLEPPAAGPNGIVYLRYGLAPMGFTRRGKWRTDRGVGRGD